MKLKTGADGKTLALLTAKGATLPLPAAVAPDRFFDQDPEVTVQLVNESEQCWTATFSTAKMNEAELFKTKLP